MFHLHFEFLFHPAYFLQIQNDSGEKALYGKCKNTCFFENGA